MKKVYCSECRHYYTCDVGGYCTVADSTSSTWFQRTSQTLEAMEANKNNDCKYYLGKRGLVEWINDLIKAI